MKIYFVILNYNTASETNKLVESIFVYKRKSDDIHIVIVDNDSTDDSYNILKDMWHFDKRIEIFKMPANIGFSRANNFGYEQVLKDSGAELCIVCNSDILIIQEDFFEKIEQEFQQSHFGILSPDVICKDDMNMPWKGHQSPAYPFESSAFYIKYHYKKTIMSLERSLQIFDLFFYMKRVIYVIIGRYYRYITKHKYKRYRLERHENVPVHGGFLILSKTFMDKFDKLFYPETMFYGEEILLFIRAKKRGVKIVYSPDILVEHLQGKSTKHIDLPLEKKYFVESNLAFSDLTILKELL